MLTAVMSLLSQIDEKESAADKLNKLETQVKNATNFALQYGDTKLPINYHVLRFHCPKWGALEAEFPDAPVFHIDEKLPGVTLAGLQACLAFCANPECTMKSDGHPCHLQLTHYQLDHGHCGISIRQHNRAWKSYRSTASGHTRRCWACIDSEGRQHSQNY